MSPVTILSWVLAGAPASPPPEPVTAEFVNELAHVEMIDTGGDVQLLAYDSTGKTIGVIALWTGDANSMHVAADFEDGYDELVFDDGKPRRSTSLAPGVAGERARAMLDVLAQSDSQEGKVSCGLAILGTAIACAGSAALLPAIGCATGSYEIACHCAEFLGTKPTEGWC
jgi:hypothetical protein